MRDISIYIYIILHNLTSWDLTWTNMGLSRDIYIYNGNITNNRISLGYHWDMTGCRLRLAISHGKIKWHDGTVGTSYVYGLKRELNQQ